MKNKEDVKKLPQWAQNRIELLEGHLKEEKARVETFLGKKPSRVSVRHWNGNIHDIKYFPEETYRFQVAGENDYVEVTIKDGSLDVRTGDRLLIVLPEGSNSLSIFPKRHSEFHK